MDKILQIFSDPTIGTNFQKRISKNVSKNIICNFFPKICPQKIPFLTKKLKKFSTIKKFLKQ